MMIVGVLDVTQTGNLSNTCLSATVTLTFTVTWAFLYASNNVTRNTFQLQSQVPSYTIAFRHTVLNQAGTIRSTHGRNWNALEIIAGRTTSTLHSVSLPERCLSLLDQHNVSETIIHTIIQT